MQRMRQSRRPDELCIFDALVISSGIIISIINHANHNRLNKYFILQKFIAIIPLMVYISGFVASLSMRVVNKCLGRKVSLYCLQVQGFIVIDCSDLK